MNVRYSHTHYAVQHSTFIHIQTCQRSAKIRTASACCLYIFSSGVRHVVEYC